MPVLLTVGEVVYWQHFPGVPGEVVKVNIENGKCGVVFFGDRTKVVDIDFLALEYADNHS